MINNYNITSSPCPNITNEQSEGKKMIKVLINYFIFQISLNPFQL